MGELMPVWLARACLAAESGARGVAAAADDDEGKCRGDDAWPLLPLEVGCSAGGEDAIGTRRGKVWERDG